MKNAIQDRVAAALASDPKSTELSFFGDFADRLGQLKAASARIEEEERAIKAFVLARLPEGERAFSGSLFKVTVVTNPAASTKWKEIAHDLDPTVDNKDHPLYQKHTVVKPVTAFRVTAQ